MKIYKILCYTFFTASLSLFTNGITATSLHAAEAQSAPVAQKKPVAQKAPVARAKIQPRQSASHLTDIEHSAPRTAPPATAVQNTTVVATKHVSPKTQHAAAGDKIKNTLDVFARNCIATMNNQRMPGIRQKEVKRQPDGSFMARYLAVDPDSLQTSYNPTNGHKTIPYVGRMDYHEVEYVSIGKSQKQALAGPFNEVTRFPITELIKYKQGKWCY